MAYSEGAVLQGKASDTKEVIGRTLSATIHGNERPPVLIRDACLTEQCPRATFRGLHRAVDGVSPRRMSVERCCKGKKVLHNEFQNESGHFKAFRQ